MTAFARQPDAYPPSYPSLFGRQTAVFAGHEKLHAMVAQLEAMCRAISSCDGRSTSAPRPALLFQLFMDELEEHFEVEESEQYYGTLAAVSPEMRGTVSDLCAEHAAILRALATLIVSAAEGGDTELIGPTEDLLRLLDQHERRETRLMREFLSKEVP
jgi:hypothetical protein